MNNLTKEALGSLELFNHISSKTIDELLIYGKQECYAAGTYIFRDHDVLCCFYIVLSGRVTLYKISENGQNKVMFILGPGSLLNETIFEDIPSSINTKAFEDCELLVFYKEDFIKIMEKDFLLTQTIVNLLSKRVRRLYRQLKNSTSTTRMEKKLAAKIWKLGKDYGVPNEKGTYITLPLTVTSLAELLGSYRETVSRALKVLIEQELVIYEAKHITILDVNALSTFFKTP